MKRNHNKSCLIDHDKNEITGTCVIMVSGGYKNGCKIKEEGKTRDCTRADMILHQGFPKGYKFVPKGIHLTKTKLHKVLGESFPPKAAKVLGKRIKKLL